MERKWAALVFVCIAVAGLLLGMPQRGARKGGRVVADTPRFRFADVASRYGIDVASRTWGSAWADRDLDGDPDLLIGRHWGYPLLYRNDGGLKRERYRDLRRNGLDRHACAWGEGDGDGKPDLYCVRGADKGKGEGHNQLLVNERGRLVNRAPSLEVADERGRGRTVNWLDYDVDGDLDIFVGNMARRGSPNVMFRNDRGSWTRVQIGLSDELHTVSSSWADWDDDGDPDLLVLQSEDRPSIAYENVGGAFVEATIPRITDRSWSASAWADYDGDGRVDVHLVDDEAALLLRNTEKGFAPVHHSWLDHGRMSAWMDADNDSRLDLFVVQGAPGNHPVAGAANEPDVLIVQGERGFFRYQRPSFAGPHTGNGDAVAVADHDGDGRLDALVTNGLFHWTGTNSLLENHSPAGNAVELRLRGDRWNPFGFGAEVSITSGSVVQVRHVTDSFNFRTQSDPGFVHAGLGSDRVANVEVLWPDGTKDCIVAVASTPLVLEKGGTPCAVSER